MEIIIFIFCLIVVFFIGFVVARAVFKDDIKQIERNKEDLVSLNQKREELKKHIDALEKEEKIASENVVKINDIKELQEDKLSNIYKQISDLESNANQKVENLKQAYLNYCDILDKSYDEADKEYDKKIEDLEFDLLLVKEELNNLCSTRNAAIEAFRKEEEIKKDPSEHCLKVSLADKSDIKMLETLKEQLNYPRVVSMLIWSTWFQKPMTELCNKLIGTGKVSGIYKITNQLTGECYIGQSVNLSDRWKTHAKCGLGIDAPKSNKLYAAMAQYGIWNFSWEILELCQETELNEKEKFYIELYNSYNYGYNSTTGNKK